MFREWGFLISEMVVLIILAALLGLLVGWLIWGRRSTVSENAGEADALRRKLDACQAKHADKDARVLALQAELDAAPKQPVAAIAEVTTPEVTAAALDAVDYDGDGKIEGADEGVKPETLRAARGGKADDLKQIKGIGPKLEKMCNALGFYHFDQIAKWSADEEAWVNANLEGFKGRVSRDTWVVIPPFLMGSACRTTRPFSVSWRV
jgi:predicted flap endonuclease-1-like 5' DNA nuclease